MDELKSIDKLNNKDDEIRHGCLSRPPSMMFVQNNLPRGSPVVRQKFFSTLGGHVVNNLLWVTRSICANVSCG